MMEQKKEWQTKRIEDSPIQKNDARDPYDADYARIVHSASFRRLQGKTQILSLGDGDFYRTRLTHSLEVSQIAWGLVIQLLSSEKIEDFRHILPKQNLVQSISLAHDLGHPPFGHGGEIALNYCMRDHGGFEGNAQTLRILTKLEKFSQNAGSNLTFRSLLGILKYPAKYEDIKNPEILPALCEQTTAIKILDSKKSKPPKCYFDSEDETVKQIFSAIFCKEDVEKFQLSTEKEGGHRKTIYKSFDCSIMDIADDISYGIHDLEDAIALGLVSQGAFRESLKEETIKVLLDDLVKSYPDEFSDKAYDKFVEKLFSDGSTRKRQISRMVHRLITRIEINKLGSFKEDIFDYQVSLPKEWKEFLKSLQEFVADRVIMSPEVQHLEFKGQHMVVSVFEALAGEPKRLLPRETYDRLYDKADTDNKKLRVICDHIAGMTDNFLLKTYDRLFSPRMGSIFDRL